MLKKCLGGENSELFLGSRQKVLADPCSSEAVMRLDYQILLKSPHLTLLAGSALGQKVLFLTALSIFHLQIGHILRAFVHFKQHYMWQHGMKTMAASLSNSRQTRKCVFQGKQIENYGMGKNIVTAAGVQRSKLLKSK